MNGPPPRVGPDDRSWSVDVNYRPPKRYRRAVAAVLGALALVAAVAVLAGFGSGRVDAAVGAARLVVYVFAHFALVLGAWSAWRAWFDAGDDAETSLPPPDETDETDETVIGSDVNGMLRRLADPSATVQGWQRVRVEKAVRSVAIDVLRAEADAEFDDVAAAIDEGTWTDDPRAAAYLGDVPLPVRLRVIDWASGDPHRRRIDATVAELAAVAGVETEVEAP